VVAPAIIAVLSGAKAGHALKALSAVP